MSIKSQAKKIEAMSKREKAFYLASGRVVVGHINQVVSDKNNRLVFKTWYVAKIRGVPVGSKGEYKHETPEAAKKHGERILAAWKADLLEGQPS